ncbi:hypothetical protein T265_01301 [Opisthorchis viverrini]|uniref:Uncharacterized protein n=1 Tax=Opisthorchis viverrini TaxID=6198 RepID=A0A075A2Z3_OPIVI|nr:hypothetical protein T265_01301 [Opisthorchis viverrini]KER32612.1 hypothetical protein T265_01301 [Opisthorchis viverrini]
MIEASALQDTGDETAGALPLPEASCSKLHMIRIRELKKEIICLHQSIEVERLLRESGLLKIERKCDKYDALLEYVDLCITEKEGEIKNIEKALKRQDELFQNELMQHNVILAKIQKEINLTKDQYNNKKSGLVKKLSEMQHIQQSRSELMSKYEIIKRTIDDKLVEHNKYCLERNLQHTIEKNCLQEEVKTRIAQMAEEFRIAAKQREKHCQIKTLYANGVLFQRWYKLARKLQNAQGKNQFLRLATKKLRIEIDLSESIKVQMQKKLMKRLKALLVQLKKCKIQEEAYQDSQGSLSTEIGDVKTVDLKPVSRTMEMRERRQTLFTRMCAEKAELQEAKMLSEQLNQTLYSEYDQLKRLTLAREKMTSLLTEMMKALAQAKELFESNKAIADSEGSIRKQRLLAVFFALLYMTNRLCGSVTPNKLGIARVSRQMFVTHFSSDSGVSLAKRRSERPSRPLQLGSGISNVNTSGNETRSLIGQLSKNSQRLIGKHLGLSTSSVGVQATPAWLRRTMNALEEILGEPEACASEKLTSSKRRPWLEIDCNICGQLFSVPET